jgi:hypothetical protein
MEIKDPGTGPPRRGKGDPALSPTSTVEPSPAKPSWLWGFQADPLWPMAPLRVGIGPASEKGAPSRSGQLDFFAMYVWGMSYSASSRRAGVLVTRYRLGVIHQRAPVYEQIVVRI